MTRAAPGHLPRRRSRRTFACVTRRTTPEPETESRDAETSIASLAPALNFKIPLAERVRAAAGPPACFLRKRQIEDLDASLLRLMDDALVTESDAERARAALLTHKEVARDLKRLEQLVRSHNRYYPIEANLPMNPMTGRVMERNQPWVPLPEPTFDALFERARYEHRRR